jgi:molecular chaperone DnaK
LKPLLGIDFGTSTARAALAVGRDIKMVSHGANATAIPSVVAFPPVASGGGPPLVGTVASTITARHPERTITAIKRLLGRKLEAPEVRHHRQTVPYDLVGARNGDVRVRIGRRYHAAQDIAAYIMGALRTAAEHQLGGPVTETVLAVPALFDDLQRQAIRDAARIAGLDVKALLTGAAAAALGSGGYPAPRGEDRKVIIYDLGGGSFEVAAVQIGDEEAKVIASGGDAFLGGEDFDQRIVTGVCEELLRVDGGESRRDRSLLARLKQVAERAKIELSVSTAAEIRLPDAGSRAPGAIRLDRARLETLTQDLVDRTMWACETVLREAKWAVNEVDVVLLIGGQTRMPRIRAQIEELFGKPPVDAAAPESFVAIGAARQAAMLAGSGRRGKARGRSAVLETTSLSLGVESAGGVFTRIIPRGTALPVTRSQVLVTSVDGQTQIVMHLLQGEREMASDNESVAHIQIGPVPARPKGEIQIEVEISTDGGGVPGATAQDAVTREPRPVRVRPTAGLGEAEIAALMVVHAGGPVPQAELASDIVTPDVEVGDADSELEARAGHRMNPTAQGG